MTTTIHQLPHLAQHPKAKPAETTARSLPIAGHDAVHFSGDKKTAPKQEAQGVFSRMSKFKVPVAALGLASMFGPGMARPVQAAITPESDQLVKALSSEDEELVTAAMLNLSSVNERDAVPFLKKVLAEHKMSDDGLNAAVKAAGLLGANSTDAEKAEISKLLMPYVLKVVVEDKDKVSKFVDFQTAVGMFEQKPETTKVKDAGLAAARALGKNADVNTLLRMAKTAQDSTQALDVRWLSLEAIKHAPANADVDKEVAKLFSTLNEKSDGPLYSQAITILIRHNVADAWPKLENIISPKPATPTPPMPTPPNPTPVPVQKEIDMKMIRPSLQPSRMQPKDEEDMGMFFFGGRGGPREDQPSKVQQLIINEILTQKRPEHAPLIMKQMAKYPGYFSQRFSFFGPGAMGKTVEFLRAMGPNTQKDMVSLLNLDNAQKLALEVNPKQPYYPSPEAEQADDKKVMDKARAIRKMAIAMTSSLKLAEAGPEYQKLFTNNLENMSLRYLGIASSAAIKDVTAVKPLLKLAVDETEDIDLRYDALSAVLDIAQPELAEGLNSDSNFMKSMERYLSDFSEKPKFTQSFYKAQMFSEIRDIRQALIRAKAPQQAIDDATLKVIDKKIKAFTMGDAFRTTMAADPELKEIADKLVGYIANEKNADGFFRILTIVAAGEGKLAEAKPALKELMKEPLSRTQIADIASSNDMFMFPGYTKQTVAATTRLAAIQALGKTGDLGDTELLQKAIRSDNRRIHIFALKALADIGKNNPAVVVPPKTVDNPDGTKSVVDGVVIGEVERAAARQTLLDRLPKVTLKASDRMDSFLKKMYVEAIDQLGGSDQLLKLMDTTNDTVLKRAIAHGMIHNGKNLENPKVAQFLLANSLGVDALHAQGIDGRGTEIAILDGDYINDDVEGLKGKIVYPEWGHTKDAALRQSFHGESVASAMAGKKANVTYGIAPGVDKIYSYAAWDDNTEADRSTPLEESDGMIRSIDDIIAKKIAGKTKVSVVNMSLGGTAALLYGDETTVKFYIEKLASRFEAGSKAGITFVISAGNEGSEDFYHHLVGTLNVLGFNKENGKLAQSKGVLLVGASDTRGTQDRNKHEVSWFSSVGDVFNASQPDIVAPGANIPLVDREVNGEYSIDEMDGTSFSAPITAATLLLMQQAHGKPMETEMIKQILAKTAYKLSDTPQFQQGNGGLDAVKAVEASKNSKLASDFNQFLDSLSSYLKLKEIPVASPAQEAPAEVKAENK